MAASPDAITPGATLNLRGVAVRHEPGFAAGQGVDAAEGAAELDGQRFQIEVAYSDLRR